MSKTAYYNIQLDILNTREALDKCRNYFGDEKNHTIFFLNAHCFNIAQKHSAYYNAINNADLLLNDGIGIKLGAMFTKSRIKDNLNGTDFVPRVVSLARELDKNVYLLGGEEGVALKAKKILEEKFPGITVVGARNGYFDFNDDAEIVAEIVKQEADLLIVGMGVPRQELWLIKNKNHLKGVKISIAGGAVLDFISGNVKRAPLWMRKSGTEWVFRLLQEPTRLFNRYFIGIPVFFFHLLKLKKV